MASRTPGLYVPLDVNYARDPRIRLAGPNAELLYIRGLAYAKQSGTDGAIPRYDLPIVSVGLKGVKTAVAMLVHHGLWEEFPEGWLIRSWQKWNLTQQQIADQKKARAMAAMRTNHERWHGDRYDANCQLCLDGE